MKDTTRINEQIRASEVRLIAADGAQIGIVPIAEARRLASEAELDLVEVAPGASPTVCRVMDFRKLIYDQQRKAKVARKRVRQAELKEIKMRPTIDPHDHAVKVRHLREFLEKGHKVKVTVQYKGREMVHFSRGTDLLQRTLKDVADLAVAEVSPRQQGRTQSLIVAPKRAS